MGRIFEEYGSVIIAVIVVVALVALISWLVVGDGSGVIDKAFNDLVQKFFTEASGQIDAMG